MNTQKELRVTLVKDLFLQFYCQFFPTVIHNSKPI